MNAHVARCFQNPPKMVDFPGDSGFITPLRPKKELLPRDFVSPEARGSAAVAAMWAPSAGGAGGRRKLRPQGAG